MSDKANLELEILDLKEKLAKVTEERDTFETQVTYLENIVSDTKSGNLHLAAQLIEANEEIAKLKGGQSS